MKLKTINPNNEPYYSEDFIKGFKCGAQRQFEADKADRPQGKWIDVWQDGICSWRGTCSVCRSTNDIPPPFEANYCPSCGARMLAKGINVPNKKGAGND